MKPPAAARTCSYDFGYWYHTGENAAIRQLLGHADLPVFVGNIDDEAPYRPEP